MGWVMTAKEREVFADVYRFYQKHRTNTSDAQWQMAAHEMGEIENKHNSPLCRNMLIAIWDAFFDQKEGVKI